MARKINVKLIMELRDAGLSRSTIASTRHISRHSVSDVFNIADEKGIRYSDIRNLEEQEVYRLFYPEKFANETMYGDPDEYSCVGVPLFRRNGYRQSGGRKPLFRNRDTALN